MLSELGLPGDAEELRALGKESAAHLAEWWSLDASVRAAVSANATPAATPPVSRDPSTSSCASAAPSAIVPQPSWLSGPVHDEVGRRLCVLPDAPAAVVFRSHTFPSFGYGPVLSRLLSDHPSLCALRFECCAFSESFCEQLPAVLGAQPQLTSICIRGTPDGAYGRAPSLSTMKSGPLFGGSGGAERDEPLAFLPMHLPASVRELYLEAGAISRGGVRVLGAALHSAPNLSTLSLAQGSLRPTDLTPLFTLLQGQGGAGAPQCALLRLSLRANKLLDAGLGRSWRRWSLAAARARAGWKRSMWRPTR